MNIETLDMLAKKRKDVVLTVVTSEHRDRNGNPCPLIKTADVVKFNAQYPTLYIKFSEAFHDRFLIIDDNELYLIGASLKDLVSYRATNGRRVYLVLPPLARGAKK